MAKKEKPETFVRHCDMFIPLKDGKATCPKCKDEFESGKWTKFSPRSFKKKPARRGRNAANDMIFDLGLLFLIVPPALWFIGIWNNGLKSFRMDVFTLVVLLSLSGFVMIGGFGKGKKAR